MSYRDRLRELPRQDYRQLAQGTTSRRAAIRAEEIAIESTTDLRDRTTPDTEMEQLVSALTELTKFQQEQERRRVDERKREEEERHRHEELSKQQHKDHQEQVKEMQEQHKAQMDAMVSAMRDSRPPPNSHLKITPFQETEDIQDFLDAFEGIMNLQGVERAEWVLRLTPLLNGRARTVCTDLGGTASYDGVKKAILSHYNINTERCRKQFRAHVWTRNAEPNEWVARGVKLMKRWLRPDEGVDKMIEKIAVEQFIDSLPQELRIWVASNNPTTPDKVAELIESYDSAHGHHRNRVKPRHFEHKARVPSAKEPSQSSQEKSKEDRPSHRREKKPLAEIVCYKCDKKGHLARNCPEKSCHVQEGMERIVVVR